MYLYRYGYPRSRLLAETSTLSVCEFDSSTFADPFRLVTLPPSSIRVCWIESPLSLLSLCSLSSRELSVDVITLSAVSSCNPLLLSPAIVVSVGLSSPSTPNSSFSSFATSSVSDSIESLSALISYGSKVINELRSVRVDLAWMVAKYCLGSSSGNKSRTVFGNRASTFSGSSLLPKAGYDGFVVDFLLLPSE